MLTTMSWSQVGPPYSFCFVGFKQAAFSTPVYSFENEVLDINLCFLFLKSAEAFLPTGVKTLLHEFSPPVFACPSNIQFLRYWKALR
jgi:hypothetical protein